MIIRLLYEGEVVGIDNTIAKDMGYELELEAAVKSMKAMLKRGIRVLPGGDYGFAWAPHGENAKDLEYFVKYLGMTPMETLISATRWGGQIMMKQGPRRDPRGLARRPAARRRRPALEHLDAAGQVQAARDHEGRRVREDAGDPLAAQPVRRMKQKLEMVLGARDRRCRSWRSSTWGLWDNARLFVVTFLNGMTLASLYFIVAAGSRWCSA